MKRTIPFFALLVSAVAAQAGISITSTSPALIPAGGGTVIVQMTGFPVCFESTQGCTFTASVDDHSASITDQWPRFFVTVPPHARGSATLKIAASSGEGASTTIHFGEGAADNERVLLPIVTPSPVSGANGSLWTAELRAANLGTDSTEIRSGSSTITLSGNRATQLTPSSGFGSPGAFIWAPRFSSDSVTFGSRVRDLSRQSQDWGTEISVARERDFHTHIALIDVATAAGFRVLLRVYGYSEAPQPVRIVMSDLRSSSTLFDQTLTTTGIVSVLPIEMPDSPSFLQLPVSVPAERVRIDVVSMTAQPLWAFASITNNDTQHVTVVTPQQ